MTSLNASTLRLTSRQFGLVTRLTEGQVEGLVGRGALEVAHCGTYRIPGTACPPEQAAMAAVLRCRPRARLTGPFVLGLLGVEGFSASDPFEVLVPPERRVQRVPFPVRPDRLHDRFAAARGELTVVTATRALVDTARTVTGTRLIVGIDSARWLGLTRIDRLLRCADGFRRHPGPTAIRDLAASGALDHESQGERSVAAIFADHDPPLDPQVWITPRIRVDFLWSDVRMILEYNGERTHSLPHDRAEDRARDRSLRKLGYHAEYITSTDLAKPDVPRARILAVRRTLVATRRATA